MRQSQSGSPTNSAPPASEQTFLASKKDVNAKAKETKRRAVRLKSRRTKFQVDSEGYPRWHNAVAGAAAGASARLLTAPLDLLKIRRQLSGLTGGAAAAAVAPAPMSSATNGGVGGMRSSLLHIVRTEGGIKSLFRGNLAATYLWITYAAVQFSMYARTSDIISGFAPNAEFGCVQCEPNWALHAPTPVKTAFRCIASTEGGVAFVSGATAGVGATIATYPFDICRTAFASRGLICPKAGGTNLAVPKTISEFAKSMYRTNGLRGFYAGSGPAVVQIVPYMGLNFAFYDHFVRMSDRHNVGNAGAAGAVAGGLSKLIVYPMDTVKRRLQAQGFGGIMPNLPGKEGAVQYKGLIDCAVTMSRTEGMGAFYRGLVPSVMKSMTATGLTFAFYTLSKNTLEKIHDKIYYSDMI